MRILGIQRVSQDIIQAATKNMRNIGEKCHSVLMKNGNNSFRSCDTVMKKLPIE